MLRQIVRCNKRIIKCFSIAVVIALLLSLLVHIAGVNQLETYSRVSKDLTNIINSYLAEDSQYPFSDFTFRGRLPSGLDSKKLVEWNDQLFKDEMNKEIDQSKLLPLYDPKYKKRSDATFVVQVKNKDLRDLITTIEQIESVFNSRFQYPYVFLNMNREYTNNFENTIKKMLPNRELYFEYIQLNDLRRPRNIDRGKEQNGARKLQTEGLVPTTNMALLRNLFRYSSYQLFQHERLKQFKWYWRFEPGTKFYGQIDYDVFEFMLDNDKTFGFTLATYEYDPLTVENLLPVTLEFLSTANNFKYLHRNNSNGYLMENLVNPEKSALANGYSTCHFWSSFEIGNMDFFRGEAYTMYFEFLDRSGGFYYDRWGDGPVHSMALSLFEDKSKLHWFKDIGYSQFPFTHCPNVTDASCTVGEFSEEQFSNLNCIPMWLQYSGLYTS